MGDMRYKELSNRLAESEEALGELRVKYKDSLAKRRELAEQLYEISENSSFEEANIDALANKVKNMNDDNSNLSREMETLSIWMSQDLEARRATEDKIKEKDHEISKLNGEISDLHAHLHEEKEEKEKIQVDLDMTMSLRESLMKKNEDLTKESPG